MEAAVHTMCSEENIICGGSTIEIRVWWSKTYVRQWNSVFGIGIKWFGGHNTMYSGQNITYVGQIRGSTLEMWTRTLHFIAVLVPLSYILFPPQNTIPTT